MATRERSTKRSRRDTGAERTVEGAERRKGGDRGPAAGPGASPEALYRAEKARRQAQLPTTQALEEARREFEQMLRESRPAGTGGRPREKPAPAPDEVELEEFGEEGAAPDDAGPEEE